MIIPIIVLTFVFVLIALRQIGNIKFGIWQIMFFGAFSVLITGQISLASALKA
ncbi:anion transporter, partial [archaeon]|nr:anion transporter [archaeon]